MERHFTAVPNQAAAHILQFCSFLPFLLSPQKHSILKKKKSKAKRKPTTWTLFSVILNFISNHFPLAQQKLEECKAHSDDFSSRLAPQFWGYPLEIILKSAALATTFPGHFQVKMVFISWPRSSYFHSCSWIFYSSFSFLTFIFRFISILDLSLESHFFHCSKLPHSL